MAGRGARLKQLAEARARQQREDADTAERHELSSCESSPSNPQSTTSSISGAAASSVPTQGRGRAAILRERIAKMKLKKEEEAKSARPGSFSDSGITSEPASSTIETTSPMAGASSIAGASPMAVASPMAEAAPAPPVIRRGKAGKVTPVTANYLMLMVDESKGIHQHEVSFEPQIDDVKERYNLLDQLKDVLGPVRNFDGTKLYLPKKFEEINPMFAELRTTKEKVKIKLSFKNKVLPSTDEARNFYNILFNKILKKLGYVHMNRNHYSPEAKETIPQHKLQIWPGFVLSVDEFEGGLQVLVDVSHRVLRDETAYDILKKCGRKTEGIKVEAEKELLGSTVLTRYNNKIYRIDEIVFEQKPTSTFTNSYGQELSFIDYYQRQYGLTIRDVNQPMLLSRPKKKAMNEGPKEILLVPELCNLTGLTGPMREDYRVMKDVGAVTRLDPGRRQRSLADLVKRINTSDEAVNLLKGWGLKLKDQTVDLDGRILPACTLIFGRNYTEAVGPNADWGRTATTRPVLTPVHISKWIVICTERGKMNAKNFCETYAQEAPRIGINLAGPIVKILKDDRVETYLRAIRDNVNESVQLVVTIVPQLRADRYSAIKKLCYIEKPIASQVVVERTISNDKKLRSVTQKIALQINCKLGGELWGVRCPKKNMMVVGIDVFHDPARKSASIYGFVSSLNDKYSRWHSTTCEQRPHQEITDSLMGSFATSLTAYNNVNHTYPDLIIVFRDGVGDSQLEIVKSHEIPQFKKCFKDCDQENYKPNFFFIVVQKRINTRIYQKNGPSKFDNPAPGCVVDYHVTRKELYDFFLISQKVGQGTVSPSHYVVVEEGHTLTPDEVQRISYMLTHMYPNWPGTVRVPAPCQLAHKLANMVGEHLHKLPSPQLNERLFFL